MTKNSLLNNKKEYWCCQKCGVVYAKVVAEKYDKKCHMCGGRLKKKEV
ncbi:MAG: hypothetical protein ACOCRO_04745 [Halanaerobiales bacterium]